MTDQPTTTTEGPDLGLHPHITDDLSEWELRQPGVSHLFLAHDDGSVIIHFVRACSGMQHPGVLPWPMVEAIWRDGIAHGNRGRWVGWCQNCAVKRVAA